MERPLPPKPAGWHQPAPTLTVGDVWRRLLARPVLAGVPVVLGLGAGLGYAFLAPPTYLATASVIVQPVLADQFGNLNLANVITMATEEELAQSRAVAEAAAATLGISADSVLSSLSVDSPPDTQVLNVRFRAGTPQAAAAGAQTVAQTYLTAREGAASKDADRRLAAVQKQIDEVNAKLVGKTTAQSSAYQDDLRALLADQRTLTGIKATSGGRVITPAVEPKQKASPKLLVGLGAGLGAGVVVGLVLAVLWPSRRRTATPRRGSASRMPATLRPPGRGSADPAGTPGGPGSEPQDADLTAALTTSPAADPTSPAAVPSSPADVAPNGPAGVPSGAPANVTVGVPAPASATVAATVQPPMPPLPAPAADAPLRDVERGTPEPVAADSVVAAAPFRGPVRGPSAARPAPVRGDWLTIDPPALDPVDVPPAVVLTDAGPATGRDGAGLDVPVAVSAPRASRPAAGGSVPRPGGRSARTPADANGRSSGAASDGTSEQPAGPAEPATGPRARGAWYS